LLTTLSEDQLEGLGLTKRQAWTVKELYRGTSAAKLRQIANIQYGLSYHPELEQLFKKFGTRNVQKLKAIILDRFERTYGPNPHDNAPGLSRITNSEASLRGTGKHNAQPAASTEGKTPRMTLRSDYGSPLTPQQFTSFIQAHGRPPRPGETW
jgi:hypothetical protein